LLSILLPLSGRFLLFYIKNRFRRHCLIGIILLSIVPGLYETARYYQSVPDYQLSQKAVSLSVLPYAARGLPVYTDDACLAITMHFYLRKRVTLVPDVEPILPVAYVFVSKRPLENALERYEYYIAVIEGNMNTMKYDLESGPQVDKLTARAVMNTT
jgi:hypothetical protein